MPTPPRIFGNSQEDKSRKGRRPPLPKPPAIFSPSEKSQVVGGRNEDVLDVQYQTPITSREATTPMSHVASSSTPRLIAGNNIQETPETPLTSALTSTPVNASTTLEELTTDCSKSVCKGKLLFILIYVGKEYKAIKNEWLKLDFTSGVNESH